MADHTAKAHLRLPKDKNVTKTTQDNANDCRVECILCFMVSAHR